jgi:hypothetical protein
VHGLLATHGDPEQVRRATTGSDRAVVDPDPESRRRTRRAEDQSTTSFVKTHQVTQRAGQSADLGNRPPCRGGKLVDIDRSLTGARRREQRGHQDERRR